MPEPSLRDTATPGQIDHAASMRAGRPIRMPRGGSVDICPDCDGEGDPVHAAPIPGRYMVRHPLPGQPRQWSVIDAATGRRLFTMSSYEAARLRAVRMQEAFFAEPEARDYPAGHDV